MSGFWSGIFGGKNDASQQERAITVSDSLHYAALPDAFPLPPIEPVQAITRNPRRKQTDGLENVITGMGTNLDKRTYTCYSAVNTLNQFTLEAMYRQSWLAKRIVNTIPDDMTRNWRKFFLNSAENIKKITDYEEKICVKSKLLSAMYWGRLYGGAIAVMITDDMDFNDPVSTQTPLDLNNIKKDSLKSILVYDRWRLYPDAELIADVESPDFGLPAYYHLTSSQELPAGVPKIHHSRILRFDGEIIPWYSFTANARWHDSVLQHVYDSIINNESAKQSLNSMMYEANIDVLKYKDLAITLANSEDGEALIGKRIAVTMRGKGNNKAIILDSEDEYDKKSNTFANLDKVVTEFNIDVCGASKYPMTKLFGVSSNGLSSTGEEDETKYYDELGSEREHKLDPNLRKLDQVLIRSVFGSMPTEYRYEWPSFWQESDLETSEIEANRATRDEKYVAMKAITPKTVAASLKDSGTFKTLTDEDVNKASDDYAEDVVPMINQANPLNKKDTKTSEKTKTKTELRKEAKK